MAADKVGMSQNTAGIFFSQFGMTTLDETAATGVVSGALPGSAVVFLGANDKRVTSGSGDIFVYASTGGNDTIVVNGAPSQLVMTDVASTDVTLERPNGGNDLLIVNNKTGAVVTIAGQFGSSGLASIAFSDGVSLTPSSLGTSLRSEAVNYIVAAASNGATFAQEQTQLNTFGFTSSSRRCGDAGAGNSGGDIILIGTGDKTASGGGGADICSFVGRRRHHRRRPRASRASCSATSTTSGVSEPQRFERRSRHHRHCDRKDRDGEREFSQLGTARCRPSPADGTVWKTADIRTRLIAQEEAASNGTVFGFTTSDTLDGAAPAIGG